MTAHRTKTQPAPCCRNRRHFLGTGTMGLGSLGLAWLLQRDGLLGAAPEPQSPTVESVVYDTTPKSPHFAPRAKAMISLFMGGGPSHIDLFDPKPTLAGHDGKQFSGDISFDNAPQASKMVMASPFRFKKQGESGIEVSELLPHTAEIVDDITLIRSMNLGGVRNHVAGIRAMDTGRPLGGRPALGSWVTYGLGSEGQDLPAFVALVVAQPPGAPHWSSGMLPSIYQGTFVRDKEPRILNLDPPGYLRGDAQESQLSLLKEINERHLQAHPGENDLEARIASYELAALMQTSAREALEISQESPLVHKLYGLDKPETRRMGEACLIARRLVERGVRFVQIWNYSWDHHEGINNRLPVTCGQTDQPSAALVKDLKARGMLDTTLVHWGGEMGRLPVIQAATSGRPGRDHNTDGFSIWLAGGGVKAGHVHGATDEFGLHAVEDVVHHHDYLATVLHLLGLDARKLTYKANGRFQTILDGQEGRVLEGLLG